MVRFTLRLAGLIAVLICSGPMGAAAADLPGDPGSDERRHWCAAQLASCTETAKKPGFLGGPLNFCTEASGAKDCVSICEIKYGVASACLTAAGTAANPK